MARFEVVAGRAIGMSILLDDELLIGRHADGAGRLADDDEISRSHARISLDRSGFCAIEDLGSTNGTFVNGLRIAGPQTLSVGDTIEVGGTTLVVRELPIPTTERALRAVHPQPTIAPRGPGSTSQETPSIARGPSGRGAQLKNSTQSTFRRLATLAAPGHFCYIMFEPVRAEPGRAGRTRCLPSNVRPGSSPNCGAPEPSGWRI